MAVIEPQFDAAGGDAQPFSVMAPDGSVRPGAVPGMPAEQVAQALELMLLTREFDDRALRLQRQGRFGTFSQVRGQEAAVVGSAFALDPARDWVVPQYRELPALLRQGYPLEHFIAYFTGNPSGGGIPDGVNCLPLNIALASHLPHAVGLAWGLRHQGGDGVVLTYFGDGASSEGDAHESMNLAALRGAPVVFFLSNNGWAISTPRSAQSAARTLASRAIGYGMPGIVVDGNDLLAVHRATADAVARARAGGGPTLIEAITYRTGAHNTADDPTRYVDPAERAQWEQRDPIDRVTRYLTSQGLWGAQQRTAAEARITARIDEAFAVAAARPTAGPEQLFDHLYGSPPQRVARQRSMWTSADRKAV